MEMICGMLYTLFRLFLLYIFIKLLKFAYKNLIRKPIDLQTRYGKDSYILVTGGTDGIGKQFCIQFAKLGYNIIFVARNLLKLQSVQKEFQETFPKIKTHIIQFDFSVQVTKKDYEDIFGSLQNTFDISVLINNVGVSQRDCFTNFTLDQVYAHINTNVISQSALTNLLIKKMLQRNSRSALITMSSYSALLPLVLSSMYSSTKVFNDNLTRAINNELKGKNMDVLVVRPMYVDTPSRREHKNEFGKITAEECVEGALKDLGYEEISYGSWKHELKAIFLNIVPTCLINWVRGRNNKEKFN